MNLDNYSEIISHKKIVLTDKKGGKTKFCLLNDSQRKIAKVSVPCLKLQGKSCDYLLIIDINQTSIEIYVELKGCRVDQAFEQIENTIKQISQNPKKLLKYGYIIHIRCPSGTDIQNKQKEFRRKYNACLSVKKSGFTENLQNLG